MYRCFSSYLSLFNLHFFIVRLLAIFLLFDFNLALFACFLCKYYLGGDSYGCRGAFWHRPRGPSLVEPSLLAEDAGCPPYLLAAGVENSLDPGPV
jgi:hypothetical protein